ncbi:unnamed protein product [Fraxinus pennsylvanica]|uniref:Uncharacterized protein n=1 Tax=Fraxinus pennsylvanica TaxID=56036 RepID=A0AAD1ZMH9_9LAMI|nr:unnamed protein product [Fraxinus pennsylvanica]
MQKTVKKNFSKSVIDKFILFNSEIHPSYLKEKAYILINTADRATGSSPTERDCRSEEIERKSNTDCDITVQKTFHEKEPVFGKWIRLERKNNWRGLVFEDGIKDCRMNLLDQYQDPMPSDSVQVNSDLAKNESMFSIGDPQESEKEGPDNDDIQLSVLESPPNQLFRSFGARTRLAEDLNVLDSRQKDILMHEVGTQVTHNLERDDCISNNDKNKGKNLVDESSCYKYVSSVKDWIIPMSDGLNDEKKLERQSSSCQGEELPSKDYKIKQIEEWVMDLQYCSPLEETNECAISNDPELKDHDTVLEVPATAKLDGKANPRMEAAKRHISSMNATATTAQFANIGLVVILFLSAFVSVKAL